ncbi:hypothetical protein JCM8115_004398 [Rhodotorula mucilaginosa]
MSYYPVDANTAKEVSLVFLPARVAAVATALSGVASFIALVSTAEYVRVQPPTASNLWAVVPQVISYIMVLCLATIGFATASIFVALAPLARCDGEACEHQNRAIRTICALAVAIVAIASLGILVTYDLHATRPEAEAAVYRAEVRETMLYARWRRDQLDGEALWVARSAWTSPSFRDSRDTRAGELSGSGAPSWESRRTADFPEAPGIFSSAPSGTATARRFWPHSLASVGKQSHHRHRQDDTDESPHQQKHGDDPSTDSDTVETGTSEDKKAPHHEHEHKQRKHVHGREGRHHHDHHHHHCHHHHQDGTTSDTDSSSSEEDRRRRSKKATVDANVMSRQSAASSVASANAGDSMPTE